MPIFSDDLGGLRDSRLPVRFRVGAATLEHRGETLGISAEQFILSTTLKLQTGLRLTMRIRVPPEISGNPLSEIEMCGRIVSMSELPDGKFGYQVELDPRA
ncbi:MAG: hypothetical protein WBR26_10375 [Candidatus Acidiferrum sp.]